MLHFADGTMFDGGFEADQIHGLVVMVSPDGTAPLFPDTACAALP